MKKILAFLTITEIQIKTILKLHLALKRMATVTSSKNNKCWRGCKVEKDNSTLLVECKPVQPCGNQ